MTLRLGVASLLAAWLVLLELVGSSASPASGGGAGQASLSPYTVLTQAHVALPEPRSIEGQQGREGIPQPRPLTAALAEHCRLTQTARK